MVAAVTPVRLEWRLRRNEHTLPPLLKIAKSALDVVRAETPRIAALRLEREACLVTRSAEASCMAFDWARRTAWSVHGQVTFQQLVDLVAEVAGSGQRAIFGATVIEPIGPAPSRIVLAIRRHVTPYNEVELAALARLARAVAPRFEELVPARDPAGPFI